MKLSIEQLISIISAVGISAIIGTIFTFIQFNKKNSLDFVTTERAEWRRQLKQILIDLTDDEKRTVAITKLKSQINPYGKNMDIKNSKPYYMKDGHIWDILDKHEIDYDRLSLYIELLLKYDWERSKSEVSFNPIKVINRVLNFLLFFSSLYCIYHIIHIIIFVKIQTGVTDIPYIINATISIVAYILILLQPVITNTFISNPSEKQKEQIWIFIILYAFPYICITWNLIYIFNLGMPFYFISVASSIAYEILYLYLPYTYEDTYVKEIKRYLE